MSWRSSSDSDSSTATRARRRPRPSAAAFAPISSADVVAYQSVSWWADMSAVAMAPGTACTECAWIARALSVVG